MSRSFPVRGLYAITNGPRPDLITAVSAALDGGAACIQYRDTTQDHTRRLQEASALAQLCHAHNIPLVIDNDCALAQACNADGVHVHTIEDATTARAALGPQAIVGLSCKSSLTTAQLALAVGASYISFGVCYASPTLPQAKPIPHELFAESAVLELPRVAIGGITADNGAALVAAGADVLASISGVFDAPDITAAARAYLSCF
ncbi:MAG: thiamine phosphate synthase [Thermomonas sp.]|uniref:thiamine phosphate synthase n=1 Tax=Thermomonas sp. TaxID=1971895 RepID=UPI001ED2E984|nr:thiamine phosphate synthase [Thermomonas sp.]MBV2208801.1 thiamine phosphate synthase [Thermomonas sp.]